MYIVCQVSFPGVKWLGSGVDHTPLSSTEVKERLKLCPYAPSVPPLYVIG